MRRPAEDNGRQTREPRESRHQATNHAEKTQRLASKSQRRDENNDENRINTEEAVETRVYGLGGQMALETATSKKAQQRMRRRLQKEEEEKKEQ